ncbi:hypothetical protein G9A89_008740 [Geosiphon pyriformis]|nr:hypothetical protein G9A89_008740 [Geosiphon pyriformis]
MITFTMWQHLIQQQFLKSGQAKPNSNLQLSKTAWLFKYRLTEQDKEIHSRANTITYNSIIIKDIKPETATLKPKLTFSKKAAAPVFMFKVPKPHRDLSI